MSPAPDARLSWGSDFGHAVRVLWRPLIPGAIIVAGAYALWLTSVRAEQRTRDAVVQSEAGRVREELVHALDTRAALLRRFVAEHPGLAGGDTTGLEQAFGESGAPFRAILVLDSALAVRRMLPASARVTSAAALADDESRATALRVVTEPPPKDAALVTTAPLASGERQVLVCAPVTLNSRRDGFVVGVGRERDVLDAALARSVRAGFAIGVFEGSDFVYGTQLVDGGPGTQNAREDVTLRDAVMWRIELWPAADLAREFEAHAPLWILALGTLLGFFVSLSLYLWRDDTP